MILPFDGIWLLQINYSPHFFSFTAQGLITVSVIAGIGLRIIAILRKFDRNFSMWLWEHEVMWQHHKATHSVPVFPSLIVERRKQPRTKVTHIEDEESET